jgi:hypothetical protein
VGGKTKNRVPKVSVPEPAQFISLEDRLAVPTVNVIQRESKEPGDAMKPEYAVYGFVVAILIIDAMLIARPRQSGLLVALILDAGLISVCLILKLMRRSKPKPIDSNDISCDAVVAKAIEVFGSSRLATEWLSSRNDFLGKSPVEALQDGQASKVLDALISIEHGVYR